MDHAAWRKRNAVLVEYFIGSTAQALYGITLKNRFRFALRRTGSGFDFFVKATQHKARLTALHAICVQIFRHIAQKSLAIRQYACGISMQSAEKSDNAPYAQALCGVA